MGITLNIGCGERIFEEYPEGNKCINIDERPELSNVHIVGDVRTLPFENDHFDYILASDILEHFPLAEMRDLLTEWIRVLKPAGIIEFRTPNMKWAAQYYLQTGDAKFVSYHIFGGQDYSGNFHYIMFDRKWLKQMMAFFKCQEISYVEDGSNMIVKFRKI